VRHVSCSDSRHHAGQSGDQELVRLIQENLGAAYAGLVSRKSTCAVELCPVGYRVFQAAVLSSFGLFDRNASGIHHASAGAGESARRIG
jgi:hypothetical protein